MYPMELDKKTDEKTNLSKTELVITLNVEAAKLYKTPYPRSRACINQYCRLSDSNPKVQNCEGQVEYFESEVHRGQQIRWVAKPVDSQDKFTVAIESIVYAFFKDNELDESRLENFFNSMAICSSDGETVRAKINEDIKPGAAVNIYNINFNIGKEGMKTKRFSLDPRLKIEK